MIKKCRDFVTHFVFAHQIVVRQSKWCLWERYFVDLAGTLQKLLRSFLVIDDYAKNGASEDV